VAARISGVENFLQKKPHAVIARSHAVARREPVERRDKGGRRGNLMHGGAPANPLGFALLNPTYRLALSMPE